MKKGQEIERLAKENCMLKEQLQGYGELKLQAEIDELQYKKALVEIRLQ